MVCFMSLATKRDRRSLVTIERAPRLTIACGVYSSVAKSASCSIRSLMWKDDRHMLGSATPVIRDTTAADSLDRTGLLVVGSVFVALVIDGMDLQMLALALPDISKELHLSSVRAGAL